MSDNIIEKQIENARTTVSMVVVKLTEEINWRIQKSHLVELMRKTFKQFDDCALSELWQTASKSGGDYGSLDDIKKQFAILKDRYDGTLVESK